MKRLSLNGFSEDRAITVMSKIFAVKARHVGHENGECIIRTSLVPQKRLIDLDRLKNNQQPDNPLDTAVMMLALLGCYAMFAAIGVRDPFFLKSIALLSSLRLCGVIYAAKFEPFRSWHGAEHMAIGAYQKTGSTELENIMREPREHQSCGTRIPVMLLMIMVSVIFGYVIFCFTLLYILAALIFDGVSKNCFPIIKQLSILTQKYITTAPPGQCELLTAKAAIDALLEHHNPTLT